MHVFVHICECESQESIVSYLKRYKELFVERS